MEVIYLLHIIYARNTGENTYVVPTTEDFFHPFRPSNESLGRNVFRDKWLFFLFFLNFNAFIWWCRKLLRRSVVGRMDLCSSTIHVLRLLLWVMLLDWRHIWRPDCVLVLE